MIIIKANLFEAKNFQFINFVYSILFGFA